MKTWLLAVFACARAVLYPNSEIVVVASTKEQAGIIVADKITSLYNNYPNLAREISNIVTNMNKWEIVFQNGSVLKIVASRDSSRGKRLPPLMETLLKNWVKTVKAEMLMPC